MRYSTATRGFEAAYKASILQGQTRKLLSTLVATLPGPSFFADGKASKDKSEKSKEKKDEKEKKSGSDGKDDKGKDGDG